MFRWSFRGAAIALGLLLSLSVGVPASWGCEGAECQTEGKPLDLKKFLRDQAASTRTPEAMKQTRGKASRHKHSARSSASHQTLAKARHPGKQAVAARSQRQAEPEAPTNDGASASATPLAARSDVQVVPADELNDIDRAAGPQAAETTGRAPDNDHDAQSSAPDVQMVVASDFNEIDRKAAERMESAGAVSAATSHVDGSTKSWMQWLWSAIGAGFIALAGLARYSTA